MIRRTRTSSTGAPRGRPRPPRFTASPVPPVLRQGLWTRRLLWAAAFTVIGGTLLWLMWPVLAILAAASGIAYILDPLVDRLEARGLSRELAIGVLLVLFLGGAAIVLLLMIPPFITKLAEIVVVVQDLFVHLDTRLAPAAAWIEAQTGRRVPLDLAELQASMPGYIEEALPKIQGTASAAVKGLFTRGLGVINAVVNLTLLPLFIFYLLRDWDHILLRIGDLVPPLLRPRVERVAREVDLRLSAFVRGQLTVCLILGGLRFLLMRF